MAQVSLDRWSDGDLALLRAGNAPGMTAHLGGPETEAQGRGHAAAAVRLVVDDAREHGRFPLLTALPSADNLASNALCATTGFTVRGQDDIVFRGTHLHVTVWGVDL